MVSPDFVDTTLTFPVRPIETVDFSFRTIITEKKQGQERRIPVRTEYRMGVSIGTLTLRQTCDSEGNEIHEFDEFLEFYKEVGGNKGTFRYKNFFDYEATKDPVVISVAGGAITSTYSLGKLVAGETDIFQLIKVYDVAGVARTGKTLRLIDAPTLEVFVDDVQTFNFTVDDQLGQIQILDTLAGEEVITFNCEFFLEMRFAMESVDQNNKLNNIKEITGIELLEEVGTTDNILVASDFANLDQDLALPFIPENNVGTAQEIKLDSLTNLRENRQTRYTTPSNVFAYQSTPGSEQEAWYLVTWFIVCKGRLLGFKAVDASVWARFDSDSFRVTAIAIEDIVTTNPLIAATGQVFCGDTVTVEQFSFISKEDVSLAPQLPDFIVGEINFLDINIGFSDTTEPLPGEFGGVAGASAAPAVSASAGSSSGQPGEGFGVAAGNVAPPVLPPFFQILAINEISTVPVIIGRNTGTNSFLLATPNLPYDGSYNVVDIGIDIGSSSAVQSGTLLLYNLVNDCLYSVIRDDAGSNQIYLFKVTNNLTWQLLPCGKGGNNALTFYLFENYITWLGSNVSIFTVENPPAVIDGLTTNAGGGGFANQDVGFPHIYDDFDGDPVILDKTMYFSPGNLGPPPGIPAVPRSLIFQRVGGAWVQEFDISVISNNAISKASGDFAHGAYDPFTDSWAWAYPNIDLYTPPNLADPGQVTGGLQQFIGFFGYAEGILTWWGARPYVPGGSVPYRFELGRTSYFKNVMIYKTDIGQTWAFIHLPTGMNYNFSDIVGISSNPIAVGVGQNYVVALHSGVGLQTAYLNFSDI